MLVLRLGLGPGRCLRPQEDPKWGSDPEINRATDKLRLDATGVRPLTRCAVTKLQRSARRHNRVKERARPVGEHDGQPAHHQTRGGISRVTLARRSAGGTGS